MLPRMRSVFLGSDTNRSPRRSARRYQSQRLFLEMLERRDVPSAAPIFDGYLVRFDQSIGGDAAAAALAHVGAVVREHLQTAPMAANGYGALDLVSMPQGLPVQQAVRVLQGLPGVWFAEPNWVYSHQAVSNDPYYVNGSLWGMYGDATTPANQYGSQAGEAWAAGATGSSQIYVGVIDEGIQFTHPDIAANVWTNPYDPIDNLDNDGNGVADDVHGWDFFNGDNTIYDGTGDDHGTHVTGTIGAVGGNGIGVAGVNWNVTYISAKFLGPSGGSTAGAILSVDYITDLKTRHGLNIVATNNSWGGGGFSQGLLDAITRAAQQNILFIAAAGNASNNNDVSPFYPANYNTTSGAGYDGVIAVAAIDSAGNLASFSSYGATTVDIGAPGVSVLSTVPTDSYAYYSGTSMATPHVTGGAALYASTHPGATALQIKNAILSSAVPTTSLAGKTVTGGRLNVSGFAVPVGPTVSINDASVTEGQSGAVAISFTVTLSASSTQTVTVNYATADGTATAGSGDYSAGSGTVTFNPGETSKSITVFVNGDTVVEPNETFTVNLSGAVNATIADSQGVGTIVNDDASPITVSINDVAQLEGTGRNGTYTDFVFTVSLSGPSTQQVSVNFATANGSAVSSGNKPDYLATSGVLVFNPNETSKTIVVRVTRDKFNEGNETFFVNLSGAVNASIADSQGLGTIQNDD